MGLVRFIARWLGRGLAFAWRHRWSVPCALLSAAFFGRLSSELRENELGPFDTAVASAVARTRGELDGPMLWLTRLGNGGSLLLLGAGCGLVLLTLRRQRETAFLAAIGAGTFILSVTLKLAFRRARPGESVLYMIHSPRSFSFPSGHALASTAVLFGLVVVARVMGLRGVRLSLLSGVAVVLVLGIASSRVYFGVHFPSDVLGGLLAGVAWVSAVTGWFYPRVLPGEATAASDPAR